MAISMCVILWRTGPIIVLDAHQHQKWHLIVRVTGCRARQPITVLLWENPGFVTWRHRPMNRGTPQLLPVFKLWVHWKRGKKRVYLWKQKTYNASLSLGTERQIRKKRKLEQAWIFCTRIFSLIKEKVHSLVGRAWAHIPLEMRLSSTSTTHTHSLHEPHERKSETQWNSHQYLAELQMRAQWPT